MRYLERQAKRTVEGFNITNENYQKALDLLCERFGNTQVIITTHMNELLKIKYLKSDKDVTSLRQLYDTLEVHIRSLLSLNIDSQSYGTLISPVVMKRLPHSAKLIISRNLKDKGWDLTELLLNIKNELYARQTYKNSQVEKDPELPFSATALHATQKSNHSNLSCAFCKENYFSDKCPKVTDIATRRKYFRDSGRCSMCLRSGHTISECTSTKTCYYSIERHNSALCVKREKGISTNLSVKENTSILLQTAVVRLTNKINSKSVNICVLFDSGLQKSYLTQRIVDCLELQKIASESINVSVFGQSNFISKNVNIFSFCMSGVSENQKYREKIPINTYAVLMLYICCIDLQSI